MHVVLRAINDATDMPVAVVAIKTVCPNQRHVGIAYRETGNNHRSLLHLPWHYNPLKVALDSAYWWVEHKVPPLRIQQVAAFCRQLAEANPNGLPYAFSYPNDCFDQVTGDFLLGPSQFGLTCATFVLAVFHAVGLMLVQLESWPNNREGDSQWQEHILGLLKSEANKGRVSEEHIDAVENQIGAVRCRPEEVAGASAAEFHPVHFNEAARLAKEVLEHLPSQ